MADQIYSVLEDHKITASQIQSTVTDGAYHHDNVQKYLEEILEVEPGEIHHAWDAMHKSALEDGHVLNLSEYKWVVKVTETVCDVFKLFRKGQKYFLLNEICNRLQLKLAQLATLPETRMANYKYVVLRSFVKDLKPLIIGLDEIQADKCSGNIKDREQADIAAKFKTMIHNRKFVLELTGMADIYSVYGHITNILQKVDYLPHEKYDKFKSLVKILEVMGETVNVSLCPGCSPSPSNHPPSTSSWSSTTRETDGSNNSQAERQDNEDSSGDNTDDEYKFEVVNENGENIEKILNVTNEKDLEPASSSGGSCRRLCHWKEFHKSLKELEDTGKYQGLRYHDDTDNYIDTMFDRTRA